MLGKNHTFCIGLDYLSLLFRFSEWGNLKFKLARGRLSENKGERWGRKSVSYATWHEKNISSGNALDLRGGFISKNILESNKNCSFWNRQSKNTKHKEN